MGRLTSRSLVDVDGRWQIRDAEEADREWAENTDVSRAPNEVKEAAEGVTTRGAVTRSGRNSRKASPLSEASAREKNARANLVELEYLSKAGKLIDADAAINAQVEMAVRVRTRVLGVTSRVRQRCPDAARAILTAIDEELRLALEEVADGAKGAAA